MGGAPKQPSQPAYQAPAADPTIDPATGMKYKKAKRGGGSSTILTGAQGVGSSTDSSKKNVLGA